MRRVCGVALFLLLLSLFPACEARSPWVGRQAPNFTAADLQGNTISLQSYRGKVVLLDFWATWCGPCLMELPNVKQVYNKYNSDGFVVIGISLDSDRSELESLVRYAGIEWPQVFDGSGWRNNVSRLYGVNAIPATFLLDRSGVIRYTDLRGRQDLEDAVNSLLNNS